MGDALGADIEFNSLAEIRQRFGHAGLQDLVEHDGRTGAITDDTQMTLFTAEAFLAFRRRAESYGAAVFAPALYYSYQRWMATQGEQPVAGKRAVELRGLLLDSQDLHHRRGPGNTCLTALRSGIFGTVDRPINNSKGCGGVMRVAPLAEWDGLRFGEAAAAITHGHPTGQLAAGALVVILHAIGAGATLNEAIDIALAELAERPSHEETSHALIGARTLAAAATRTSPEAIEKLGE
ncbi:MAG: ADP-ribosylglycohydrolase family protein, partial [Corynebacteriales bacterium]|nr:ADP-ribosylglycohydrolase family protein [Mycobacteriales bacterium]